VADMPGVDKKDVKIKIKENSVVLSAHVSNELKDEGKNYYREERTYEDYYREVPLPVPVKKEGSKATLKNGTLRLELKKNDAENGDSDVKIE
jgi:HSP20 family protein